MDIDAFFQGGTVIKNPNYTKSKKNPQPEYIRVVDNTSYQSALADTYSNAAPEQDYNTRHLGDVNKYLKYGITPNKYTTQLELDRQLANNQSNWEKAGNALAQAVVGEIALGGIKGFSDLFDFTIGTAFRAATGEENDYTNAVSSYLEGLQEDFRNATPIYATPGVNIQNGGLTDPSWWFKHLPSVATTLSLLIPAKGVSMGVSKVGSLIKTTQAGRRAAVSTQRFLGNVLGGQTKLSRAELMGKFTAEGTIMRVAENYQESRQTFNEMLPEAIAKLEEMDDEEYAEYIKNHKAILGDDIDKLSKADVAKRIASWAADETFKSDMANVVFDIYQMYALRNVGRFMTAPNRIQIKRLHKLQMKNPNKSVTELKQMLNERKTLTKVWDNIKDYSKLTTVGVGAQLSEGVEEAINYAAQQEGLSYGKALLHKIADNKEYLESNFKNEVLPFSRIDYETLKRYAVAPDLWDSAFWGVMGGVLFSGAGSAFNAASAAKERRDNKKRLKESGVTEDNIAAMEDRWQTNEIKKRTNALEYRHEQFIEAENKIKQIDNGIDPYTGLSIKGNEGAINRAKQKVKEDLYINIMLNAMDSGHWNLDKEFLNNENVVDELINKGVITREEANKQREEIKRISKFVEKEYNRNMKYIYNAILDEPFVDLTDVPIEAYQYIARQNIGHKITSNRLKEEQDILEQEILEEQNDENIKKELEALRIPNVRNYIKNRVYAENLGQLLAEKKALEEDAELAPTLIGQNLLREINEKIDIVKERIKENTIGPENFAMRLATYRTAYAHRKNTEKDAQPYKIQNTEELQAIDNAIMLHSKETLKRYEIFDEEELNLLTDFDTLAKDSYKIDSDFNTLFDNDANRVAKNLRDISKTLYDGYINLENLELTRLFAENNVAVTRDAIKRELDIFNNTLYESKAIMLDMLTAKIQKLAKDYGVNEIQKLIRDIAANKKPSGVYDSFNSDEKQTFDDISKAMNLNKAINTELVTRLQNALVYNSIIDFTKIDEEKSSTTSEKPSETTTSTSPMTSSSPTVEEVLEDRSGTSEEKPIEEPPLDNTPKRILVTPDTTETNEAGITIQEAADDDTSENVIEGVYNDDGTIELLTEDIDKDGAHWLHGSDKLFDDNSTEKSEYITIKSNPIVKVNEDGSVTVVKKGVIEDYVEDTSEDKESSTGEPSAAELRAGEMPSDNLGEEIYNAINEYIKNNDTYNYQDVVNYIREKFKNHEVDRIKKFVEVYLPMLEPAAESLGLTVESVPIKNLIFFSRISDAENASVRDAIIKILDSAFKDILDNYKKVSSLEQDKIGNKYVISLEDLLRYCNKVAKTEKESTFLYDGIKRVIEADKTSYIVLDNNLTKQEVIENSKKSAEVRQNEIINGKNVTSINIKRFIRILTDYLDNPTDAGRRNRAQQVLSDVRNNNKQITEVEVENYLDRIYTALSNAKSGDKLIYRHQSGPGKTSTGLSFFIEGVKVGEIPMVEQNFEGTHYIMNNRYWMVDIPMNGEHTSKYYELIKRILIPEQNDEIGKEVHKIFLEYLDKSLNNSKDKEIYAIKLLNAIENAFPENGVISKYLKGSRAINATDHLVDLFTYSKQVNDAILQTIDDETLKEKYKDKIENLNRENRAASLQTWIDKLQESYKQATELYSNSNLEVTIDKISPGSLVESDEFNPISDTIVNKDDISIGIITFDNSSEGTVAKDLGAPILNTSFNPGQPFIAIRDTANNIYQAQIRTAKVKDLIDKNRTIKNIFADIETELLDLLDKWTINTSSDELYDFFQKLVDRKSGYTPLFQGIGLSKRNGGNGFVLSYTTEDGSKMSITFFDKVSSNGMTYNASNLEIYGKNGAINKKGPIHVKAKDKAKADLLKADLITAIKNNLKFNIDFTYINSDKNNNPINGFATRKNGKFVIKIRETEYTFNSFNDFIINNNAVEVKIGNENGSNFYRPGEGGAYDSAVVTYKIVNSESSPVEEPITPPSNVDNNKSQIIATIGKGIVSRKLLNKLLDDTKLKVLKNSGIIQKLLNKNVIFVENYNELYYKDNEGNLVKVPDTAKAAYHSADVIYYDKDNNEIKVAKGTIVVGPRWIDLSVGNESQKEEAIRDIFHESVHAVLRSDEGKHWEDVANNIFNKFINYELTDANDIALREKYTSLGLEEFLVESMTRPELMNLLNRIPYSDKVGDKVTLKKGTLLQRIIKLISDMFKVNINEGSLLQKEYELFSGIAASTESTDVSEQNDTKKPKIDVYNTDEIVNDDSAEYADIDFSTISDNTVASKQSITNKLSGETRIWFDRILDNGSINLTCK